MIDLKTPYLLFLGDVQEADKAKTAIGIATFSPEKAIGYYSMVDADINLNNLPKVKSIAKAKELGAKTFVIGLANHGGFIDPIWIPSILEAIKAGFDIASGLHKKLEDIPEIKQKSEKYGVNLYNVRHTDKDIPTGQGIKRDGIRILTVGTDCNVGKMYTTLHLERTLKTKGKKTKFVATGQTGILVSGYGISIDAVPADFISGAIETMTQDIEKDQYCFIEGQGTLYHPSYAGVSLGLLHGSAANYIVLCHDPSRDHIRKLPDYSIPDLQECIDLNIMMGSLTNPNIKCIGISCNTSAMSEDEAKIYLDKISKELGLPATDPHRFGVDNILEELI